MARSRYDVEINGDNKGLTTAVNKSMDELNKLNEVAGGLFSNLTGPLGSLQGGINTINTMNPALRALGVAGLAAGAGLAAINKAADTVNTLNQISTNTGVSVEMLQKLQRQFKDTGMEAEKFGDINKDAMDKLGDSFRNGGGGIADDLKEWGIELQEYTKYAGDAEGGIKAVIDTFYKMKEAGKSHAEITNAMESIASDSSHLITTLDKYGSTQEALNSINQQHVNITKETSAEYKNFQKNINTLNNNIQDLTVQAVTPLVAEINDLWALFNKEWTKSDMMDALKQFWYGGDTAIARLNRWVDGVDEEGYSNASKKRAANLKGLANQLAEDVQTSVQQAEQATNAQKNIIKKQQEEKDKADAKAKAARDKALADAKRNAAEQLRVQQDLLKSLKSLSVSASGANLIDYNDEGIKLIKDANTQAQLFKNIMKNLTEEYHESFKQMDGKDLGDTLSNLKDYYQTRELLLKQSLENQKITQQQYNDQMQQMQAEQKAIEEAQNGIDGKSMQLQDLDSIGFATSDEQQQLQQQKLHEQFQAFYENNQAMYDAGLIQHDDFLKQKERLDQAYAIKSQAIERQSTQMKMQMATDLTSGLSSAMTGLLGENNKAAQAMFAVSKGVAIANGMINAHEAATTAMAKYPGPLGYALAASSYANVLSEVMQMKSMTLGQFHDGIDNVPNTGTYLLQEGERVVDNRLNQDLKDFLSNQDKQQSDSQPVDASIHINGSVNGERELMQILKRHQQTVSSIVQDANRRKM
ncbi:hypothetical protein [Klebsiella quasipneumoniae]|uniref:hypothetical protein n=3 Tax=Klebsiella pneumoniae complex TaxID=3390273 RepID=UPI0027E0CE43|nr:hypothetical protein [Klebsiella quasipneumoniae]MDQ6442869.1 hypothetical protein [Klebsiella quasipneumoniae]